MISLGVDLGRSGKTAFVVLACQDWRLHLFHMEEYNSISAPEVQKYLETAVARFDPAVIVMESNGPGGVLADYLYAAHPLWPLFAFDVSQPGFTFNLYEGLVFTTQEYLNIRAQEYMLIRQLLASRRLTFEYEDPELFAQLSSTYWDIDKTKSERIRLMPKRNMRVSNYTTELEGISFSRSPDKADALALACLGYALAAQEEGDFLGTGGREDEIIEPDIPGLFPIGRADIEVD